MSAVTEGGEMPGLLPGPLTVKMPHRSPATSPARKRMKLDLPATVAADPSALKKKLYEWRMGRLRRKKTSYRDNMAELFFLKNGTNITDNLQQFRKKPSKQFLSFLVSSSAPASVVTEVETVVTVPGERAGPSLARPSQSYSPHLTPTSLPLSPVKIGETQDIFSARQTASRPSQNSVSMPPPSAPVYTPEQVGERTKQEGWVVRRVAELTRDGLWPARRLPQVAERPRPVSAWDLVLEEMRWLATDFAQERLWKKAAARVQSAAAREHVVRRREQDQAVELEMASQEHKRKIAKHIAEKVAVFWREVSTCYHQQEVKRQELHHSKSLAQQALIVSSVQPAVSLKRKHSESLTIPATPLTPESQHENGVNSDTESSISEQESWELLNTVVDSEMKDLSSDNRMELGELVRTRYPGYEEDLRVRWEEGEEEEGDLSDWDTDSECEEGGEAAPSDTSGLLSLAQQASSLTVSEGGQAQLDWLLTLHRHNLPALLLADHNKVPTVSSLLAHLVTEAASPGPHLLIVPVTTFSRWSSALASSVPGLTVVQYTGGPQDRRRARERVSLASLSPNIVLTTYRTFFLDSAWFLTRPWPLLVLTESQNIISAASTDQIRDLASLKAARRLLLASGELKENPIDLWNTLYLMFPSVYFQREEKGEVGVEVAGTPEYVEIKEKLLTIVTGFSYSGSRASSLSPSSQETKLGVPLNPSKQKLYDDYLAQSLAQDSSQRDLRAVTSAVQVLRDICNQPLPSSSSSPSNQSSLPGWCFINKSQSSVFSRVQEYHPLENISLDQINLVFLSQEMTTTVLTSARLRSIKASKKLIEELSSSPPAARIPRNRLQLNLESLTRNIGGGWNLGGLSLGDGVSLVKAANGQVYKMTVREKQGGSCKSDTNLQAEDSVVPPGAFHPESLQTIASVNRWRCDGFPLYGQDLIRSLEITSSTRPVQSRFRGQGYVNCLNSDDERGDWRYSTKSLAKMCQTSSQSLQLILSNCQPREDGLEDNKMKALHSVLYPAHREGQKVVVVTGLESSLPAIAGVCNKSGIRYCVVRGGETHARQMSTVTWWRLEPRLTVLVVVEVESHHSTSLDLSPADLLVLLDSGPGLWEPELGCPLVRLLSLGTVEESLCRGETVRRVLQDIKANQGQDGSLSKQTLTEIVSPQPDNGYTKKREKGLSDTDSSVWSIFSTCLAASQPDTGPVQSLLDMAELETQGEVGDGIEELDEETVELVQWLEGLDPIKRYGMRLLRDNVEMRLGLTSPAVTEMEDGKEDARLRWERKFLCQQRVEEELQSLENMLTYSQELVDREWRSEDGTVASIWRPPGQYQADLVPMETFFSGYSRTLIPDSQLPPIHVKKEKKSAPLPIAGVICQAMSPPTLTSDIVASTTGERDKNQKFKREDQSGSAPKSLFDRPRPVKMVARPRPPFPQSLSAPVQISGSLSSQFQSLKPMLREVDAGPSWTIQEDYALHQAVISVQELGLTTTSTTNAGHTINWDMVSDMVNSVSWCFRSSKQCRARWESSLVPREEGRMTQYDTTPKKLKKDKKLGLKLDKKTSQNLKTGALFKADNNNAFSSTFSGRFETIKTIANKRTPTTTPLLVNPTLRNPKHAAVLAESGIDYDSPVSPVQVAANRADRIQASKARTALLAAQTTITTASTSTTPQTVQSASPRPGSTTVSLPTQPAQAVVVGISQPLSGQQPQQVIQNSAATSRPALSVQELLKTAAVSSAIMTTTGAAVTNTSPRLPTGQILVSQAGKTGLVQTGTVVTNRQLTPQQLQLLKQQAIKKSQEQQLKQRLSNSAGPAGSGAPVSSAVAGGSSKVTVTQGLGRGQVIRQNTVRNISDPEFKALLSKQPGVKGNVVQVANSMSAAQLQQLGLQVASSPGTTSSSLVKTVSSPLVQVSPGTSKTLNISGVGGVLQAGQIKAVAGAGRGVKNPGQQLQIQKQIQLITGQKVAGGQRVALATTGKPGQPTQLIVPGNKGLPAAVTVQQLQQIVKGAGLAGGQGQVIGTITGQQGQQILSVKPSGNTLPARVIPVSGSSARGQQTIQVVTQQRQGAPNVTINQMGRPSTASELASALAAGSHVKIQAPQGASQQQILSQISTALAGHGQNVSVAVRTPSGSNTTVLQPATMVQQQGGAQGQAQQRQMVNLQLSVAQPVPQTVSTASTNNQQNNSESERN